MGGEIVERIATGVVKEVVGMIDVESEVETGTMTIGEMTMEEEKDKEMAREIIVTGVKVGEAKEVESVEVKVMNEVVEAEATEVEGEVETIGSSIGKGKIQTIRMMTMRGPETNTTKTRSGIWSEKVLPMKVQGDQGRDHQETTERTTTTMAVAFEV